MFTIEKKFELQKKINFCFNIFIFCLIIGLCLIANAPLKPAKAIKRPLFKARENVSHANKSAANDMIKASDVRDYIATVLDEEHKVEKFLHVQILSKHEQLINKYQ